MSQLARREFWFEASRTSSQQSKHPLNRATTTQIIQACTFDFKYSMVFIFASTQKHSNQVESSVGPCQFCHQPDSVDIVEYQTKTFWFGVFPTEGQLERLAVCRICRQSIREVHYHLRRSAPQASTVMGATQGSK